MLHTYFGRRLAFKKRIDPSGQPRSHSFEDLMRFLKPALKDAQVTRIANVTGLDRTNVPVTLAIRPNSKTLSTASGKGLTLEAAIASAAMESLELHIAETATPSIKYRSYEEMSSASSALNPLELPRSLGCCYRPDWKEGWVKGWDLLSDKEVFLPVQSVLLSAYRIAERSHPSLMALPIDSNGLASGGSLSEAVLSGLLEVVERDAITCNMVAYERHGRHLRNAIGELPKFKTAYQLWTSLTEKHFEVAIYDCTVDSQIPTYKCLIYDKLDLAFPPGGGYGANLDPEIAIIRAITEAAQGRAVVISGARDDVFSFDLQYARRMSSKLGKNPPKEIGKQVSAKNDSTDCFGKDIAIVCERLQAIGIRQIAVIELPSNYEGVNFVKVVVPKLEGYKGYAHRPGQRALKLFSNDDSLPLAPNRLFSIHMPAGASR